MIKFWCFLSDFCVNCVNFSEKLDFAIKNHYFLMFFDVNFDQKVVIFHSFLGSFLGFLGGYPSPSISAPLVVKKCPKLYIYNIGGQPPLWYNTCPPGPWLNRQTLKWSKMGLLKNTLISVQRGENESYKYFYCPV